MPRERGLHDALVAARLRRTGPSHVLAAAAGAAQCCAVDAVGSSKRLEIARWFYRRALREVRAESTSDTWAALLRAARNLRYAVEAVENAAEAQRGHSRAPRRSE